MISKPLLGTQINWGHPLAKGLVGCWSFNESAGDRVYDLSGYGNNGVLNGFDDTSGWRPGRTTFGLEFDGVDDDVDLGDTALPNSDYVTVSIWIKRGVWADSWSKMISKFWNADGTWSAPYIIFEIARYSSSNQINFAITREGQTSTDNGQSNYQMPEDVWVHFVLSYDGNNLRFYVDGVEDANSPVASSGTLDQQTRKIMMGREGRSSSKERFNGIIDAVKIWNRALSASEIVQLHQEPYAMFERPSLSLFVPPPAGGWASKAIGISSPAKVIGITNVNKVVGVA